MSDREQPIFDIAVIGGGINGVAIARDAAGRGFKVVLCEANDLGSATSSASSKLVHGGLRYLEHGQLGLVRESLRERETLLRIAPHLVTPLQFLLPHAPGTRPAWLVRLGLLLYDTLTARRRLGRSASIDLAAEPEGEHVRPPFRSGFSYWDCWADDARLVIATARDADQRGAEIRPCTRCVGAQRTDAGWRIELRAHGGAAESIVARALVNATGPWAGNFVTEISRTLAASPITLVKGSHIVVPRLFAGGRAFLLQNTDRRVVFVLPISAQHHLIGTTDTPFAGEPGDAAVDPDEIDYLLKVVRRYFDRPLAAADIVWRYSGVRPLFGAGGGNVSKMSREFVLDLSAARDGPPLLNVFGGKLTVHRRLAELAMDRLAPALGKPTQAWTADAALPGGDFADRATLEAEIASRYPWLSKATVHRLTSAYGAEVDRVLSNAAAEPALGRHFGH
ncbi:MAG: glycerol-3-phosphate dehydrogenase, partial [Alphaproteobacteria bacterium]